MPKATLPKKDSKDPAPQAGSIRSSRRVAHVLLIGLEPLLRHGIKAITQEALDLEVVGAIETSEDALKQTVALRPDVALTEMHLPDGSRIEVLRTIKQRCPDVCILVLSSRGDTETETTAMTAGALGDVLKDITSERLLGVIRAVFDNQAIVSPAVADQLVQCVPSRPSRDENDGNQHLWRSPGPALSQNDIEVLNRVARGLRDKEIAAQLFLSQSAVKSRLRDLYRRLRLRNRAHAVAFALEQRLLATA